MDYGEIVKRAWDGDPTFRAICKTMWGPETTAEDVIAKDGPDVSSVHVPGSCGCKSKRCKHGVSTMDNRGIEKRKQANPSLPAISTHATLGGAATVAGIAAGNSTKNRLSDVGEQIGRLRNTPEGRAGLLRAVARAKGKTKLAAAAAAVPVAGAAAGHEGKLAYQGIQRRGRSNRHLARLEDRVTHFGKAAETLTGQLTEVNEDKHQVFGWASIVEKDGAPVVDLQGDYIGIEELEKSAYDYVQKSRIGGAMHRRIDAEGNLIEKADAPYHAADLIESFVVTPEKIEKMGLPDSTPVGWWVGFKVNDPDVWDSVKSGEWKGFSIHGAGRRKTIGEVSDFDIDGAEFTR